MAAPHSSAHEVELTWAISAASFPVPLPGPGIAEMAP